MHYPVSSTPTIYVDHQSLNQMLERISQPGTRAILLGFGEYAKHLINLRPESISGVHDPRDWMAGITYKGANVAGLNRKFDGNLLVVCEHAHVYEFLGKAVDAYPGVPHFIPSVIDGRPTYEIDVFSQEAFYQELLAPHQEVPISMMSSEKIKFLVELLRYGLTFQGDVVEMGSWQGGSTWYLAKALRLLGEDRSLIAMDLFEAHMPDPTATMCTDEIKLRLTRQYEKTEIVGGLIDAPENLARIKGPICFAHIDLGPIIGAMDFVWDRLSLGAPLLLDNYGHIAAPTWHFDKFFEERGARIIRFPWSEQGLVFKR